jgi:hypothetical protein
MLTTGDRNFNSSGRAKKMTKGHPGGVAIFIIGMEDREGWESVSGSSLAPLPAVDGQEWGRRGGNVVPYLLSQCCL